MQQSGDYRDQSKFPVYKLIAAYVDLQFLCDSAPFVAFRLLPVDMVGICQETSMVFYLLFQTSLQKTSVFSLSQKISRISSPLMVHSDVFQPSGSLLSLKLDYSQNSKSHM